MSESAQHQQLVNLLITHVANEVECNSCLIMSDAADGLSLPPVTEDGFRPDVFYQYESRLYIGEAKTSNDIRTLHSRRQYESYLRKCALFSGKATFIIAVPWTDHAEASNILSGLRKKIPGCYSIVILDGIGGAI